MEWASIWIGEGGVIGRSPLIIMSRDPQAKQNGYTRLSYLAALEEGLRPYYEPGDAFMQDNAPIHGAIEVKEWHEDHGVWVIEWPPYSPDLNPIEHLWWALKKKLHELYPEFDYMTST